ncbi:MAG: hypothetical protein B7O98_08765 [Zestosphaera tikiterensis]|uniref:Uncharacterized protein n=1 Tax=Zestosphaera tikiterensis TaxID=1973259 RepID=A0A2R7Y2D5_9CREN|nr:MAG: hypothetical protein B7O98_08765 [Zestosphaera tikiterensis]
MLILKVEDPDLNLYRNTVTKLNKIKQKHPIHVDVLKRGDIVYLLSLDDGYSVTFVYQAYLKAKERGLQTSLMYARYIDEDWIPKEIRRAAERWLSKGLSSSEVETLKKLGITEHVLNRWCP